MTALKILKLVAHCACGLTYMLLFVGFHSEVLYFLPSVAYIALTFAEIEH
jgi:hypothetical protein